MVEQYFSFPLLGNEEIVECMKELQVPLQAKDLDKPSLHSVRPVYEALCESFMGLTDEEIGNLNEQAASTIEYMQVHDESVPQYIYFKQVNQLLSAAGVYDTKLADVTNPDAKRFKRNLSAIINFAKFREEKFMTFTDLSNDTESLIENKASVDEESQLLEDKIRRIHVQRQSELPQVEILEDECRELQADLKQRNKLQAKLTHEAKQLKQSSIELKDSIATLRFQKLNVDQEYEKMQSNIVRSPERLKGELRGQRETLEQGKSQLEQQITQFERLKNHVEALEKTKSQMSDISSSMAHAEKNIIGCKEASKEVKRMANGLKDHANVMRQLQNKKAELERQIKIIEDGSSRLDNTERIKLAAASHAVNEANKERDLLQRENVGVKNELDRLQSAISNSETKIARQKKIASSEVEERRAVLKRLENLFEEHTSMYQQSII